MGIPGIRSGIYRVIPKNDDDEVFAIYMETLINWRFTKLANKIIDHCIHYQLNGELQSFDM